MANTGPGYPSNSQSSPRKDPVLAGLLAGFLFPFGLLYLSGPAFGIGFVASAFSLMFFLIPLAGPFIGGGALFICAVTAGISAHQIVSKQNGQLTGQPPQPQFPQPSAQQWQTQQSVPLQQPQPTTQWVATPAPPAIDRKVAPVLPPAPGPAQSQKPYRPSY